MFKQLLALTFLLIPLVVSAQLKARFDSPTHSMNESINFTLSTNQDNKGNPDFSELEKDFTIYTQGKSSQINIINGSSHRSTTWSLTLLPKKPGVFKIPPISVGNEKSNPSQITITKDTPSTTSGTTKALMLKASVQNASPYVGAQVLYTLKLYYHIAITQASISSPSLANASVLQIGADNQYQKIIDGKNYQVLERHYLIFPNQVGKQSIDAPIITGTMNNNRQSASVFTLVNGKAFQARSNDVHLDVQAIPSFHKDPPLLAAKNVQIQQQWSSKKTKDATVGSPITRTITITADGVQAENIPNIELPNQDGIKSYAEKPQLKNQITADHGVLGSKTIKVVIIPNKKGTFILPLIKLTWWNTDTKKREHAILSEQTLTVTHGQEQNADTLPTVTTPTTQKNRPTNTIKTIHSYNFSWIPWVLAGFFAFLWLLALLRRKQEKRIENNTVAASQQAKKQAERKYVKALRRACLHNEASQVREHLLQWAQKHFDDKAISDLNKLKQQLDSPQANQLLDTLDQAIYAREEQRFNGKYFWQQLQTILRLKPIAGSALQDDLPDLFKR
jgi:hypothetical protein